MELLEVLPFIVCEHMWLISISRKHDANNKSNSEKMWFSANFISVCGKDNFAHFGACYASKNWKLMLPNLQKINQNCVNC